MQFTKDRFHHLYFDEMRIANIGHMLLNTPINSLGIKEHMGL